MGTHKIYQIKENKANGQKFVNVGKKTPFLNGDYVKIVSAYNRTLPELDRWVSENESMFDAANKNFKLLVETFFASSKFKMMDKLLEELGLEVIDGEESYQVIQVKDSGREYEYNYGEGIELCKDFVAPKTDKEAREMLLEPETLFAQKRLIDYEKSETFNWTDLHKDEKWYKDMLKDKKLLDEYMEISKEVGLVKIYADYCESLYKDVDRDIEDAFMKGLGQAVDFKHGQSYNFDFDGFRVHIFYELYEHSSSGVLHYNFTVAKDKSVKNDNDFSFYTDEKDK